MAKVYTTRCRHCYQDFTSARSDAKFCSAAHAAAHARDHGEYRDRYHEEKEEQTRKECLHCGTAFYHNDYAARGGKREPQYCSNKCRQAAYRARKGTGFTGNWDDARNDKTKGERAKQDKKKDTSQDQKKDTSQQQQQQKDTSQKWWRNSNRFQVIGVTYLNTFKEARAAYMKLVKMYHPDTSKDPDATEIMQYVNSAWDYIKDSKWRV